MRSRRPVTRLNRGRVPRRADAGGGGDSSLVSAAVASDGYTIDLTYDGTPPSDANYALTGTPEFIVGASVAGNVRTLQVSGPILDTETVTLDSDTLTAQAVTNNSTEAGADYATGLLFDIDARAGLTHAGDGTTITAAADQSGNGYDFVEIETGQGPVYRAAIAQMRGLPMIDCANSDALQSTVAGLITALTGAVPFTLVLLWCPSGNNNNSQVLSWGIKNNATNHYVSPGQIGTTCNSRINGGGQPDNRTTSNLDQWQKKPLPAVTAWVCDTATITMYAGQRGVTYDSDVFRPNASPNTVAIGARLQALAPSYSNGTFRFARMRLYNAALTAAQLRQVGRQMSVDYGIPMLGCSPARALSLV